ncbi:MAG: hypothetical protein JSV70_04820 [bacterium]|nr:MAG: hypothetical protein JSV70_04820 [bacterium]
MELVRNLEPVVKPLLEQDEEVEDVLQEAVHATLWSTMSKLIERSPTIAEAVRNGDVFLKGAVYFMETGEVTILEGECL